MTERSQLIDWIRGELVGPSRPLTDPTLIALQDNVFTDPVALRNGPLAWRLDPDSEVEEVLYFQRETPHRKYGAGALHPGAQLLAPPPEQAVQASDTLGIEPDTNDLQDDAPVGETAEAETGDGDLP